MHVGKNKIAIYCKQALQWPELNYISSDCLIRGFCSFLHLDLLLSALPALFFKVLLSKIFFSHSFAERSYHFGFKVRIAFRKQAISPERFVEHTCRRCYNWSSWRHSCICNSPTSTINSFLSPFQHYCGRATATHASKSSSLSALSYLMPCNLWTLSQFLLFFSESFASSNRNVSEWTYLKDFLRKTEEILQISCFSLIHWYFCHNFSTKNYYILFFNWL